MRRFAFTILALAVAVAANADWTHVRNAANGFSVELPDPPTQKVTNMPVQGMNVKTTTFTAQGHGALALLTVTSFPKDIGGSDAGSFRKSYIDSFIRSAHATETSRHHLTVHGVSGEEALFTMGDQVGSVWVVTAGRRGFGVTVMVPHSGLDYVKNRVFNSFKLN